MTFLRSLRALLWPPVQTGMSMNLSASSLAALKTLHSHESWPAYLALLDSAINLYAEQLLVSDNDAEVHRLRGLILGLRKAGTLVTELIRQQEYEDARRTKLDTGATNRNAARAADLFGTRYGGSGGS